jgi:hypothetical protein
MAKASHSGTDYMRGTSGKCTEKPSRGAVSLYCAAMRAILTNF